MAHALLCSHTELSPNWQGAFPDGVIDTALSEALQQARVLWVHIDHADWPTLVAERAAAGQSVVVLSAVPTAADLRTALTAGARGFEHAWASANLLQQVAGVVDHGGMWVGPELMSALIKLGGQAANEHAADEPAVDWSLLSGREREVVEAVGTGASNKEIARQLNITERTVKAHLSAIFQKLQVRDRLHLALALKRS